MTRKALLALALIEQFDCRAYWIRSSAPPHKYEQQTVCFGFRIITCAVRR